MNKCATCKKEFVGRNAYTVLCDQCADNHKRGNAAASSEFESDRDEASR
mgnify:CR=1 FL=1